MTVRRSVRCRRRKGEGEAACDNGQSKKMTPVGVGVGEMIKEDSNQSGVCLLNRDGIGVVAVGDC